MDCLKKALTQDKRVEIVVIDGTDIVNEAIRRTQAWPPSAIPLGQSILGSFLLMSISTKTDSQSLELQWNVDGPYGNIYAQADHTGKARGMLRNPQAPIDNLTTPIGAGILQVRRQLAKPVTGIVKSEGNVCTDILNYLHQSEQRQCALNLWVDLEWDENNKEQPFRAKYALGYLLEILPATNTSSEENLLSSWEDGLAQLGSLSQWQIDENNPTEGMLKFLTFGEPYKEILYQSIQYHCDCNETRARRALAFANTPESPADDSPCEVKCEFCGKSYILEPEN